MDIKALLLLAGLDTISNVMAKQETVNLKIIETSDVHGCFFPYDYIENTPMVSTDCIQFVLKIRINPLQKRACKRGYAHSKHSARAHNFSSNDKKRICAEHA